MANNEDKRVYTLIDSDLCMFTSNLVNNLTRDLSDFAVFGVTTVNVTSLKALGDAFEIFPPDDALLGDQIVARDEKDALAEQVRETIRSMALRVKLKWGNNSGQYRSLGDMNVSAVSDSVLLTTARNVHERLTAYLSDLASLGLTQPLLDDFEDLNESFEEALNELTEKVEERDLKAKERVAKGNELYGFVTNYCEMGKRLYENTNLAKYNDYIIYSGGESGKPGKIQNLAYNEIITKFTWDSDSVATVYQLEVSTDGVSWDVKYEDADAFCQIGQDPGNYYARVRGINDKGNGAWSDVLEYTVIIQAPNLTEVVYQQSNNRVVVDWQATAYADKYEVWKSEVASGQPAGTFSKISEPTNHYYYDTSYTPGNRCYYYVKAVSVAFGMTSAASTTMYAEIPV